MARCPQSGLLEMGGVSSVREEGVRGGEGGVRRRSSSLSPIRRKPTESMQACTKMAMASCGVLSCGESASAAGRLASMLRSTVGALKGRAAMVGTLGAGVALDMAIRVSKLQLGGFGGDDVVGCMWVRGACAKAAGAWVTPGHSSGDIE